MNAPFTQANRPGRLETVLGMDQLVLTGFEGEERLNGLFDFEVTCVAASSDVDFDALIGTHATVGIASISGGEQAFDGIITEARWAGLTEDGDSYRLRLQPWFFLASLRRNQRIFHNQSVVTILETLLADYAEAGEAEMRLTNDYPELEYTVQYRESDLDFACRMMERHGISYHFEHTAGEHLMVISDDCKEHEDIGPRPYVPHEGHHQRENGHIRRWSPARRITTGAIRLTDYNFKTPRASMEVDFTGDAAHKQGAIESYDYPGDYLEAGRGKVVADLRTKSERGQSERFEAQGDVVSLRAGARMTLEGDPVPGRGKEYLCLIAHHRFTANAYRTTAEASDDDAYEGAYVLMPVSQPMVPERKTPLARVYGPQTGVVVGDGEIDCDEHGRILVHLHWDLDKDYTMRCRVSQNWASRGWGGMVIPRIGMEVVVEFLEGDPDKPLVTGCVYNGTNVPPAELPANKSRSVFKTNSHQGEGFNELTFEDQSGEEFIYLHAQKNLDVHVENSSKRRVEFDDNVSIGNASNLDVAADRTETIEGKLDVKVTGAIAEKTDSDRGADVGGSYAIKTGGDLTIKAGGEIVLDASKVTLVSGGAALVVQGGAVNAAPVLNVGSASPGAAAIPAIPAVLKAAAGAGSPFVSHCPMKDDAE